MTRESISSLEGWSGMRPTGADSIWWSMCVLGLQELARGVWGAGDEGHAQSGPRAASLHGLAFNLEDAIVLGFPQAGYFSFSPVETEPAPLGEQDRDSLHSRDFPKGRRLYMFASSFSLRALKISWLFFQPWSPSTHGKHSLLTLLCPRSLLSLQSSEGCCEWRLLGAALSDQPP